MVVHPASWQVVSRAALGPEAYCSNWSKLWGTWFLDRSVKNTSMICHNTSRMQLFQDASLIGKAVKEGTAKLGLALSGKSTILANDKSLGKVIVGHLGDEGVPFCLGTSATDLGIESAPGKKICAANQWKRIWKGRRRAKRVNRLCKINSEAQKLTMTGIQPVQVHGHTAQGTSTAQENAMCKNLKMGTVMGKTQACAISTVAWFFGAKRVPQIATRVEQIREWITMWRGFIVDTRPRIRKVCWEKGSHFGKRPQTLEPSDRSNLCRCLFGFGSGLEAEHTRFLASARSQCYS